MYYETVQRFTARITETGTASTMRQYRDSLLGSQRQAQPVLLDSTEIHCKNHRDRYSQYYETVQRFTARLTETGIAYTMRQCRDSLQESQRQVQHVL